MVLALEAEKLVLAWHEYAVDLVNVADLAHVFVRGQRLEVLRHEERHSWTMFELVSDITNAVHFEIYGLLLRIFLP